MARPTGLPVAAARFDFDITTAAITLPVNAKNPTKPRTSPTINPVRSELELVPPAD